jgi:hypothetical protein
VSSSVSESDWLEKPSWWDVWSLPLPESVRQAKWALAMEAFVCGLIPWIEWPGGDLIRREFDEAAHANRSPWPMTIKRFVETCSGADPRWYDLCFRPMTYFHRGILTHHDVPAKTLAEIAWWLNTPTPRELAESRPDDDVDDLMREALRIHAQRRSDVAELERDCLLDVFGNPYRPSPVEPSWRTSDVVGIARGVYCDQALDRLPILADALIGAGCDHEPILRHCREPGPHVRGCWVVDLILGR